MAADISLVFDVAGGGSISGESGSLINSQLNDIVKAINANPLKIKFKVDETSLAAMKSQIQKITDSVNNNKSTSNNGATQNKQTSKEMNDVANNAEKASEATEKMSSNVNKANKEVKKLKQGTSEYEKAAKKITTLMSQITDKQKKWTAAANGTSKDSYKGFQNLKGSLTELLTKLQSGELSVTDFQNRIAKINNDFTNYSSNIKAANEDTKTFSQRFGGLASKFSSWLSVSQVIMQVYNALRQMVSSVVEIDTAMTELKKVTDETDSTYNRFLNNAAGRAKEVGASLSDVVTATADFARLGYSIEDAEKLADTAIIYKNVGDGIENISDASESIIATMQAFGIEASDSMSIVDKFNEVGNNYAISSEGVGESLLRSAAAMKSANNTLDETIALSAAANTIVQDPEKVGTTLKTVSMFLRAAKTEAEDAGESTEGMATSVSELRGEILALTGNKVDIQIDENNFKSTYQILKELSEVWDSLSDISQANILELVGGKRNSNVVAAILENFTVAQNALETSLNSSGSALAENETQLASIEGRISLFKAEFQDLGETFIGSSFIKGVVDFGTNLLSLFNGIAKVTEALGGLKTVLIAVSGVMLAIKLESFQGSLKKLWGSITGIWGSITGLAGKIKELPTALKIAKSEGKGLSAALDLVGISASTAQIAITAITLAITAVIAAYSAWKQKVEQQRQDMLDTAQESAQEADNIMNLYSAYQTANAAYESNTGSKEALTESTSELLSALGIEKSEIDSLVEKYGSLDDAINKTTEDALAKAVSDARSGLNAAYDNLQDNFGNGDDIGTKIAKFFGFGDGNNILSWLEDSEELNQKVGSLLNDAGLISESGYGTTGGTMYIDTDSIDGILESYDKLIQARDTLQENLSDDEYNDSKAVDEIEGKISDFKSIIDEYLSSRDLLNKSLAKQDIFTELSENGIPETSADLDKLKEKLIAAAEGSDEFSGSGEDISSAFNDAFDELKDVIPGLADVMNQSTDIVDAVSDKYALASAQITQSVTKASESTKTLISGIDAAQNALNNQKTGKSISVDDFNSDELKDYRSALEYVNGTMQLNADKVKEIAQSKADEQVAINNTNKALEQTKYLENAKQIEIYRQKLKDSSFAEGESEESIQKSIDALLAENSAIAETCDQYDLLSSSIQEAVGSYQNWLNAQTASDYGDMANDAISAVKQIRDTYDQDSDIFGNFGSKKFDAAVEFIIPDSVDSEDISAIESYMADFKKYLTFDENGAVDGLNIDEFLEKSVEAGLMSYSEDDGFKVLGGKKMEDFAEGLNMSSGMIQAFFDELQLKGAEFDWSDEAVKTIGDLAVEANEAAEALRNIEGVGDLQIKMDVSDLSTTEEQLSALDTTISEMDGVKAKFDIDSSEAERANTVIQYCLTQKQLLTQPDVMRVDTSKVEGDLGRAISLLQEFQNAQNDFEIKSKIGADTSAAQSEIDSLTKEIQGLSPDIKTKLSLDSTSTDSIKSSITALTADSLHVKASVDASAISGYNPESKTCDVIYNPKTDALPTSFDAITRTVDYTANTTKLPTSFSTLTRYVNYVKTGSVELNGTAHLSGTARAGGDWGTAPGGNTLVGELGREIVVDPRTGRWYTVGDNGAEFVNIPAGAIVFNHKQTESLLNDGYVSGRASALVSGTAMVTGGYKPYTSKNSGSSKSSSSKSSSSKSSNSTKSNSEEESWFEKQYKLHQHLVEMEQETDKEYLNWLNNAYKKAYSQGIIELDEYRKYQEEVYKGLQDLFKDRLNDVEHEISMRENYDRESKKIVSLYKTLMSDIEKEISAARKMGLTDADDYIQDLQDKWQDYANSIEDIQNDITERAEDAIDELIDFQIDALKQDIENQKDSLDEKLDYLRDFYDKQKDMLQEQYDEEKYLEEQAEKRKSVSDIQAELSMLEKDDSAWAQKRKLELQEELSDASKDLSDFEDQHALDLALDALEDSYNAQEEQLEKEMDALEERLNDPQALYNQALSDIKNNSKNQLYYTMLMYNRQYGDGKDQTVIDMWEEAFGALDEYQKLFGKSYQGITLKNETGYTADKGWDSQKVSGTNPANKVTTSSNKTSSSSSKAPSLTKGSTITVKKTATHFSSKSNNVKMASFVPGGKYTVYQTSGSQVLIGRNGVYTGWIKKSDIVGYAKGTRKATPGLHKIDEIGDETIFTSSDGSKYKMFSGGEKVLNARASEFLYDFANSGGEVIKKILKNILPGTIFDKIMPINNNNQINTGDIIINGNADNKTVSEIRRAQRAEVSFILKELNKLNK